MSKPPRVTDHALLRYLERVRGFKFNTERLAIQKVCASIPHDVAFATVKADGCLYEVRHGAVVTITPDTGFPSKTTARRVNGEATP